MKVIRPGDYLCCNDGHPHIFLAGPTPRSPEVKSWRPEAIKLLEEEKDSLFQDGIVSVPEPFLDSQAEQIEWEERYLNMATCILFWVPRNLETMPGFTANIEWGTWHKSGKVILGYPSHTPKMGYMNYYARKLNIPIRHSLNETIFRTMYMARGIDFNDT